MRKTADVVVIGGGNAGTSVAYHLAKAGVKNVVVVEQQYTPFGGSGRCAAASSGRAVSAPQYVQNLPVGISLPHSLQNMSKTSFLQLHGHMEFFIFK